MRRSRSGRRDRGIGRLPLLIFGVLIAVLIVYKHRSNIGRLMAGTENKLGKKRPQTDPALTPPAA